MNVYRLMHIHVLSVTILYKTFCWRFGQLISANLRLLKFISTETFQLVCYRCLDSVRGRRQARDWSALPGLNGAHDDVPDLYLVNGIFTVNELFQKNGDKSVTDCEYSHVPVRFFRSNGDSTFPDVAASAGLNFFRRWMALAFDNYVNVGDDFSTDRYLLRLTGTRSKRSVKVRLSTKIDIRFLWHAWFLEALIFFPVQLFIPPHSSCRQLFFG